MILCAMLLLRFLYIAYCLQLPTFEVTFVTLAVEHKTAGPCPCTLLENIVPSMDNCMLVLPKCYPYFKLAVTFKY